MPNSTYNPNYTYLPTVKGYITDVPQVWFRRDGDERVFHFDKLTSASASANIETNEVNAGWSLFPVAYLPGASTFEIEMTSGEFNSELFSMANATTYEKKDFNYYITENVTITKASEEATTAGGKLSSIPEGATVGTAAINGMKVTVASDGSLTIPDVNKTMKSGDVVEVTFGVVAEDVQVARINNRDTATGDLLLRYPVYAAANDNSISAVKGYYYRHVFKARVTQVPGFDTSYKSNSENSVTFSALDAGKWDGAVYEDAYIETAGAIKNVNVAWDPLDGSQGTEGTTGDAAANG